MCRYYGLEIDSQALSESVSPHVTVEYLDRPESDLAEQTSSFFSSVKKLISTTSLSTLAVPDVSIRFWRSQRERVLQRVREIQPDVIITTSPPHSIHELGMWLATETAIPWVADFRDPYLIDSRFQPRGIGKLRWPAHYAYKNAIYRQAWCITHAIPNLHRWARLHFPVHRERMLELRNAFPEQLTDALESHSSEAKEIVVSGTIPEPEQIQLAHAVSLLARQQPNVRLTLIGRIPACAEELFQILKDRLNLTGYLAHKQALLHVANAAVLVNFLDEGRSQTRLLSTKLYEYLASGKPIICVNPSHADRVLIRGKKGVRVVESPSVEELAEILQEALDGELHRPHGDVIDFRLRNTWRERARVLAKKLDSLVEFPPAFASASGDSRQPRASVVIPSRNRKAILRRSILSALAQSVPVEILVMDDGSTDGTIEMLRSEFPTVRCFTLGSGKGPCFQRNRGIELASSEYVFPIDDDSVFSTAHVVEQTLAEFDDPAVGAIGIPFVNPRLDWAPMQQAPADSTCLAIHAYVGAAHALRRSVFLGLGGYREHFFYMGEEGDICARMLSAGYITRMGKADPIHHLESPARSRLMADLCGRKNDVLFAWHNAPASYLPLHIIATTFNGIKTGVRQRSLLRMLRGLAMGYWSCLTYRKDRQPIPVEIYKLLRRIKKKGAVELSQIKHVLPPPKKLPQVDLTASN